MKPFARIVIPPVSRRRHRTAVHGLSLAALMAVTAAVGCSSESDDRPLVPCGVEERNVDGDVTSFVFRGYDELGNHVLSERDFELDGTVDDRFVWEYTPGGSLARYTNVFSSGRTRELTLEYGPGDTLLSATWTGLDGTPGRADYEHLDDVVIERWDRNDDGTVEDIVTYTYGPDGNLQQSSLACNGAEPVDSITTFLRDEAGRIERVEYRHDGELSDSYTAYSYNEDGLLERVQRWDGETLTFEHAHEFDASGNVRASTYGYAIFNGEFPPPWQESRSTYDAQGRILRLESFFDGNPGGTNTYVYECPDHEDSPGRRLATPDLAAPPEVMGPRGKAGPGEVDYYTLGVGSCLGPVAVSR
jgi:hypothetical protein